MPEKIPETKNLKLNVNEKLGTSRFADRLFRPSLSAHSSAKLGFARASLQNSLRLGLHSLAQKSSRKAETRSIKLKKRLKYGLKKQNGV